MTATELLAKAQVFEESARIGGEVARERLRQFERFGEQNHPDGTGGDDAEFLAYCAREAYENHRQAGSLTWLDVLREETEEVAAATDEAELRAELVQVAAVAVAWVEAIDRRRRQHPPVSATRSDA